MKKGPHKSQFLNRLTPLSDLGRRTYENLTHIDLNYLHMDVQTPTSNPFKGIDYNFYIGVLILAIFYCSYRNFF